METARTAAWAISNLARGDKAPGTPLLLANPSVIAALRDSVATGTGRCAARGGGLDPGVPDQQGKEDGVDDCGRGRGAGFDGGVCGQQGTGEWTIGLPYALLIFVCMHSACFC